MESTWSAGLSWYGVYIVMKSANAGDAVYQWHTANAMWFRLKFCYHLVWRLWLLPNCLHWSCFQHGGPHQGGEILTLPSYSLSGPYSYIVTGQQHWCCTMWQDPIHLPLISTSIPLYGSLGMQCSSTAPQPASSSLTFTFHHFWTPTNQAIFRIQVFICKYFRSYLNKIEFMEIHMANYSVPLLSVALASSKWIVSRQQCTLHRVHHWWKRHVFQQISRPST